MCIWNVGAAMGHPPNGDAKGIIDRADNCSC